MGVPEGCHKFVPMDVVKEGVIKHYKKNLRQGANSQQAAQLVVMDLIELLNIPPERHGAHVKLVASILNEYATEQYEELVKGME